MATQNLAIRETSIAGFRLMSPVSGNWRICTLTWWSEIPSYCVDGHIQTNPVATIGGIVYYILNAKGYLPAGFSGLGVGGEPE